MTFLMCGGGGLVTELYPDSLSPWTIVPPRLLCTQSYGQGDSE